MRILTALWILAVLAMGAVGWTRVAAEAPADAEVDLEAEDPAATGALPANTANTAKTDVAQPQASTLIASLTVFVLAVFVGFEIITKVPPTLHTPLMSGSNAISGIAVVGALLVAGGSAYGASRTWGLLAVILATINVVGGFLVTHRMLAMFNKPRGNPRTKPS